MTLLVDIGNTRIKWATLTGKRISEQQAKVYKDWSVDQFATEMLDTMTRPDRVVVANVGGKSIGKSLSDAIQKQWQLLPEFVHSTAIAAGVKNGYVTPANLGVDRWLAVIATYHLERRAACVVSVGTAMTIDGLDSNGQHMGGIIVPGPDLMIESLLQNTSDIASRAKEGGESLDIFASSTQAAIYQGAHHALASLIERASHDLHMRLGQLPALIITGGASSRVTPVLRIPFRFVPDLVLRGLGELAADLRATVK